MYLCQYVDKGQLLGERNLLTVKWRQVIIKKKIRIWSKSTLKQSA